jgi:ankyrin repeat protein
MIGCKDPAVFHAKLPLTLERFLKAELILNVLEQLKTVKEVKEALLSLPPTYDGCYEFSLKQIEMQGPIQREKAFKVLAWLSFAMGPLTVKALQHALSVESGDVELDEDKQPPLDDLVSVCRGLVIVDSVNDTQNIRLLHETTKSYLKNLRYDNFPPGHEIILKACLAYLSLRDFRNLCGYQIRADERSRRYPFLGYAAKYWPEHAIQGNLESRFQDSIISFLESSQRHSADELMAMHRPSAWGFESGAFWTDWNRLAINRRDSPLHAAATYGLRKTIPFLLKEKGYDIGRRNNFGETALHRAVQVGQTGAMEVLIAHGADLYAKVNHHYLTEATPIILATLCRQVDAVRELLNHGVNVNAFDPKYRTFPLHLAASMDTEMTQLLLDQGAVVNFPGKSPCFPETWPMTSLHFAIFFSHVHEGALDRVNLLLDRGANINAQSSLGNTALHMAILGGYEDLTHFLLQKGADIHLQNKQGKSAVQLAKEGGRFGWVEEAVPREILDELQKAPALCNAIWSKNYSHVRELLEIGCDIEQKDQYGNTPWDYCVLSSDVELAQILVDYMTEQNLPKHIGNVAFETAITHMTAFDYTDQKTWEATVQICRLLLPVFDGNLEFATTRSPICGYNKTFLIWAAELGRISEAELFLDFGSDVNATDVFGTTGLVYAVGNKNIQMVEFLVKRGANLRLLDKEGRTILHKADMSDNVPIKTYLEAALAEQF